MSFIIFYIEAPAVKDCCRHESCHTGLKDTADALLPVLPIQANKGGLQRRRDRSPLVRGKTTKLRTVRQRTTRRRKRPSSRDAETSVVTKTSSTVVMSSSPSSPSSSDADVDNDNYLLSPDTENWESTTVTVAKAAATKAVTENPWTGCSDEEILSNYIKTVGFALPSNDNDEDEWTTESRERSHDVEPRQTT